MTSFALYRLPREEKFTLLTQTEGAVERILSFNELNEKNGFVIAPFCISDKTPLLLLHPDASCVYHSFSDIDNNTIEEINECAEENIFAYVNNASETDERTRYGIDFRNFHSQLSQGQFKKIVLARQAEAARGTAGTFSMFRKACEDYPRMYISLFSTPFSGTWLIATPETLLESDGDTWRTIALAGTMKLDGKMMSFDTPEMENNALRSADILWSEKNIQEQRIVATYIMECLEHYSDNIQEVGPKTTRAGNLIHLRSDFVFSLEEKSILGDLIAALHPTPAVCGLPKNDTREFIIHNEFAPRNYYSGFSGPLLSDTGTHLFVSLRCLQMVKGKFLLYAGGGLLPDSIEQQEWEETEAKLETIRRIIA
jgi:isochorismate synthase